MPDITDTDAVRFSNEQIRPSANFLAQAYDGCDRVSQRWVALGSGQSALDAMRSSIRELGDFINRVHDRIHTAGLLWQSYQSQSGRAVIPNTADSIIDGSPADGRQVITGAQANLVATRLQEFLNWGDDGTFIGNANKGGGGAHLYTMLDVSNNGRDPDLAAAGLFINRCNELVADYEASSNAKLNTILAVAVHNQYTGAIA